MLDVIFERLRYTIRAEWTEGHDVSKILETYEDVTLTPPAELTAEQESSKLQVALWNERVKRHVNQEEGLERSKKRLYSTVWKLLSQTMKNKLAGKTGFAEKDDRGDVVWLVKTIRELVTDFNCHCPQVVSEAEALDKITSFRQSEKMENADYLKSLLTLVKVYEQYCGPYGLHSEASRRIEESLIGRVDEQGHALNDDAKSILREEARREIRDRAVATLIIRGACNRRYASLRKHLMTEYGLKTNKYPVTVDDAMMALNNAESQLPSKIRRGRGGNSGLSFAQTDGELVPGTNGKTVDHVTCHKCKKIGHYANKCPSNQTEEEEKNDANNGQQPP